MSNETTNSMPTAERLREGKHGRSGISAVIGWFSRTRVIAKTLWTIALALSIIALGLHIYCDFTLHNGDTNVTLLKVLGAFGLLYFLFMLEGLRISALQIRNLDDKALLNFLRQHYSEYKRQRLSALVRRFRTYHTEFVIGRQILSIVVVVSLAFTISSLHVDPAHALFDTLNLWRAGWGDYAVNILDSYATVFLTTTLLPCWIGQLLPEFMAYRQGIEFAQ
jgi:hypothetical protein